MNHTIKIIGIDPALRNTGLALAEVDLVTFEWKVTKIHLIQTENDKTLGKSVRKSSQDLAAAKHLHDEMQAFFAASGAAMAVGEVPTGTQSARGSFSNGVCCGLLASVPVPLIEVNPTEVKMASVGHKYGAKEEIIEWAVAKFPDLNWAYRKLHGKYVLKNENEHMADAVSTIPAAIKTQQFQHAAAMMRSALLGLTLAA